MKVLIDGRADGCVAVDDRALNYGDGLFETMAVKDGRILLWAAHWRRLAEGAKCLRIPLPAEEQVKSEAHSLADGQGRAVLKLVLSRGSGGRGYAPPESAQSRRILTLAAWPDYVDDWRQEGVVLGRCSVPASVQPALAGLKHLNRLENVLARTEIVEHGWQEGLMCDPAGRVIEASMSNLWLVERGVLLTPALTSSGVAGVMREELLAIAKRRGIPYRIEDIEARRLENVEEMMLSNSVIGLCPVRQYQQRQLPSREMFQRLQHELQARGAVC